jgi:hypothetical protein
MGLRIIILTTAGQVFEWLPGGSLTPTQRLIPRPATDVFTSHWDYSGCIVPDATGSQAMGYPFVWGSNYGFWGGTGPYSQPTDIRRLWQVSVPIKEIAAAYNTTHYIDSLGRLFGIGDNVMGEVGTGSELVNQVGIYPTPYGWSFVMDQDIQPAPPTQIGLGIQWAKLFSNNFLVFYKYALDVKGNVFFWGRDKSMASGRGFLNLQDGKYPNAMDVLAPLLVKPLTAIYQTYTFQLPSITVGASQSVAGSTAFLFGGATAARLVKATPVAANGIDTIGYHIVAYRWSSVSGNGGIITSPSEQSTTVTGLSPGPYQFKLQATDNNAGTISATLSVTVVAPPNQPPVAIAGSDQQTTLPCSTIILDGSGSYDPDGSIAQYHWSQLGAISGSIPVVIKYPDGPIAIVTGLSAGNYTFQLTVTDNKGLSASTTVTAVVNPAIKSLTKVMVTYYYSDGTTVTTMQQ